LTTHTLAAEFSSRIAAEFIPLVANAHNSESTMHLNQSGQVGRTVSVLHVPAYYEAVTVTYSSVINNIK
jgi:hypothetical protein